MPTKSLITVAVVEEEALVRCLLVEHIERLGRYRVVLAEAHGAAFTKVAEECSAPRLAVVGIRGASGPDSIAWIKDKWPNTRILAILCERKAVAVLGAVGAGACGLLCRLTNAVADVDEALDAVHAKGHYQPNDLLPILAEGSASTIADTAVLESLTRIEKKVLDLVCAPDLPKWEKVADTMCRSLATIESHRASIYRKMGVVEVKAAVLMGRAMGFGNGQW
ncbi:MAG: response regulator transcription factor [Flavobacteriales bacterium]|nr:response regulator transcription factor [Flavobacteriales bacterium]